MDAATTDVPGSWVTFKYMIVQCSLRMSKSILELAIDSMHTKSKVKGRSESEFPCYRAVSSSRSRVSKILDNGHMIVNCLWLRSCHARVD